MTFGKHLAIPGYFLASMFGASLAAVNAGESPQPTRKPVATSAGKMLVFVGTYTGGKSKGIYTYHLDPDSGALTQVAVAPSVNPSFVAVDPGHRFLYAVNETDTFEGKKQTGGVSAFAINANTGELRPLNTQASEGTAPCHLTVDRQAKNVLIANYSSGNVSALPIDNHGRLSPASSVDQHHGKGKDPGRQEGPHAHSIDFDPARQFVLSCDLGLDKVFVYKFDSATGKLTPNDQPSIAIEPGSGPRHFAFGADGRFLYVLNEMASTITVLEYDPLVGAARTIDSVSTLPAGNRKGSTTAEIVVHPSGKFLYASNRGHDSIAVFAINPSSGKLTLAQHQPSGGKTPRGFTVDPTGAWLVCGNQDSDNLVVMRIDQKTGKLTATDHKAEVGNPVCVVILPMAARQ